MKPNILNSLLLLFCLLATCEAGPRINCYPEPNANQNLCETRGCIWNPVDDVDGTPWCYFKDGVGYSLASQNGNTFNLRKNNGPKNPWGIDFQNIQIRTATIGGSVLNVKIGVDGRYEPPVDFPRSTIATSEILSFTTASSDDLFWFSVIRNSTNRKIFDTSLGGLIFSDQFIQLSTYLPSENMYGWGENAHQSLKVSADYCYSTRALSSFSITFLVT